MPGAASSSTRNPLSELPLSLFLPALAGDSERSPSSSSKGKEKERSDLGSAGRERDSLNKDAHRPGSPLKPRAMLAPSAKLDLASQPSGSGLMSPAKRRLLEGSPRSPRKSASMSSLRAPHASLSSSALGISSSSSVANGTPARRMMAQDDELMRSAPADEDGPQREWEVRSPARRLFMDGESERRGVTQGSPLATLAPRPMWSAGSPAFLDAAAPMNGTSTERGGAGLAPSPPINDRAGAEAGAKMPGSPTTPRPSKRSRVTKGSPAGAVDKTTAGGPLPAKASPARSTRSRAPINLLDDLEDDVYSSPARATPAKSNSKTGPSTPSSSRSHSTTKDSTSRTPTRSRAHSCTSSAHSDTEIYYDPAAISANIDVSQCGFEIWDDERERERERGDSARHLAAAGRVGHANTSDDEREDEVDQENQPPAPGSSADKVPTPLDRTDSGVRLDADCGDVAME